MANQGKAFLFAAGLCLAGTVTAQARLGQYVAAAESATRPGAVELLFVEPLLGKTLRVQGNLGGGTIREVAVAPGGKDLLVAERPSGAKADVVSRVVLDGVTVKSRKTWATGFRGAITGLAVLADGRLAVATDWTLYAVPKAGGAARELIATTTALDFDDVTAGDGRVIAAKVNPRNIHFHFHDLKTGKTTTDFIWVGEPLCFHYAVGLEGLFIGTGRGQVWFVSTISFRKGVWGGTVGGPVTSIGHDPDHGTYMLGSTGLVQNMLRGGTLGAPFAAKGFKSVVSLSYNPYATKVERYGKACPGSDKKTPTIGHVGLPIPGNADFEMTLRGALPATEAILFVGAKKESIDLTKFAMPGCWLLTTPLMHMRARTNGAGAIDLATPVPVMPSLVGGTSYFQWAILDDKANPFGIVSSDGLRTDI